MRIGVLSIGLLAFLTPLTAAWSKEDREIFRIRDEIKDHEADPSMTFYDLLGVPQGASIDDITKSFRKKSRSLHPDKVKQQLMAERTRAKKEAKKTPGVTVTKAPTQKEINAAIKIASERQARLGLVRNILSGPDRDRYDHFLKNGFPSWKGTNYYYNRYRPGLGTVMAGLFVVGGGLFHYIALYMSWKRQKDFVERYIKFARHSAWGGNLGIPGIDATPVQVPAAPAADDDDDAPQQPMNRKQRRMQEQDARKKATKERGGVKRRAGGAGPGSGTQTPKEAAAPTAGPSGAKKRVVAENGKVLVVDSLGDVYLEEQDEEGNVEEYLLDPNELPQPTFRDTAVVRLPIWFFSATIGRFFNKSSNDSDSDIDDGEEVDDDDSDAAQHTPSSDSAAEDFELLEKSTDSLTKVKTTGAQTGGKTNKRKSKKR